MANADKTTHPLRNAQNPSPNDAEAYQKTLYEFCSKIRQSEDIDAILQMTLQEICETCGLPAASIKIRMPVGSPAKINTRELDTKDLRP